MTRIVALFAFVATMILAVASCGGGTNIASPNGTLTGSKPSGTPAATGKALPAFPADKTGQVTRGASDVTTIPGSSAIQSFNGTVDGETMVLQSTDTDMAWALYQVTGLAGRDATSLGVEFTLPSLTTQYSVGVANFSDGVWKFLDTSSLPEFDFDLSKDMSRMVSQLGNLYFVVVVSGGQSVTIKDASVTSTLSDPATPKLPAEASRPLVSEGLADHIDVSWSAVDGADSYELWRMSEAAGEPWALISAQSTLTFSDAKVQLGVEYKYKVRGINAAGAGRFSDDRSGFAGTLSGDNNNGGADNNNEDVHGAITAIADRSITVEGVTFAVDDKTTFTNADGSPATFADLAVGTAIEAQLASDGNGGFLATSVQIETETDDNGGSGSGGDGSGGSGGGGNGGGGNGGGGNGGGGDGNGGGGDG